MNSTKASKQNIAGTHDAGKDKRSEQEEKRFTRRMRGNEAGGVSQGERTDGEEVGYDWLLYLAPENHKAPGRLQCVS